MLDKADTDGITMVTDTSPPIPVRPTGHGWTPVVTDGTDGTDRIFVVIDVVASVLVVDGVGIGRHG